MASKEEVWSGTRFSLLQEKIGNNYVYYRLNNEEPEQGEIEAFRQVDKKFIFPLRGDKEDTIRQLELEGFDNFDDIPRPIISNLGFGFTNKAINNFFRFKIPESIEKVVVSTKKSSEQKDNVIQINIADIKNLVSELNIQDKAHRDTKNALVANFVSKNFPDLKFNYKETNNNKSLILGNLNEKLLKQLNEDDIEKLGEFYINATQKFKRGDVAQRMISNLQKSAQQLTLQDVIKKYEKLLKKNPLENKWQKFFEENITLFDNRYIKQFGSKNIGLFSTKYPDLMLIDIYGYIDFYELKRSGTPLLREDKGRKTYYWSDELTKAIAQASDYLQKAKEKGPSLSNDIKQATSFGGGSGLDVSIINPRAIIVAGSSKELDNIAKKNQFKALRESMKDIEFLLYDEILQRLQNLLDNVNMK